MKPEGKAMVSIGVSGRRRRRVLCALFAVGAVAAAPAAGAAELKVQVHDEGSRQPLQGAAVCLGTPADLGQMGAYLTGSDGSVTYGDLLTAPLVLTVSKAGYRGTRIDIGPSDTDRVLMVPLATGGGGPVCHGPYTAVPASASGGVTVRDFRINHGAASTASAVVQLDFAASGAPNEYRASENPDFAGASWQRYQGRAPGFHLSPGAGRKTVYLQVRRLRAAGHSHLEITSNVARASIVLGGR